MIPIILVSRNKSNISLFLKKIIEKYNISPHFVFEIFPKEEELSIVQIREIKKNLVFAPSQSQLFVLHRFDKASHEAQNAFLKTLEEHNPLIHFVLIVHQHQHLAPTILSRSKIIRLEKVSEIEPEKKFFRELESFLKTGDLKILSSKTFQTNLNPEGTLLFDGFVFFFRKRLEKDPYAGKILKEIIRLRFLVEHNNISPQNAIDHLLITIRNIYHSKSKQI